MISVRLFGLSVAALGSVVAPGSVAAQGTAAAAQNAPAPGTANSADMGASTREQNAGFNRIVDSANRRPVKKGKAVPATPADIVPGTAFRDSKGHAVGLVDKVEADGAIVTTAAGKVKIPLDAFGKDRAGLLLGMTSDELLAAVRQVTLVK